MRTGSYSHIIWDWNGTLIDDAAWCLKTLNIMLERHGLPIVGSIEAYRNVFCFPIKDYYRRVGFDFDRNPFAELAIEYMELYHGDMSNMALFPEVTEILTYFKTIGLTQIILSASEKDYLLKQMEPYGIIPFFDEILGIEDIYAASKVDLGRAYMTRAKPSRALLIGDSVHDKEVADALGVECVLVANGHQSREVLNACGATVMGGLAEVRSMIEGMTQGK